ncbi:MAG: DUF362 domain-containing protein [Phycisphaerales bacterium]|nr:MAG: DUF362 domain-containing protein [Phycisphaerales bacterium]
MRHPRSTELRLSAAGFGIVLATLGAFAAVSAGGAPPDHPGMAHQAGRMHRAPAVVGRTPEMMEHDGGGSCPFSTAPVEAGPYGFIWSYPPRPENVMIPWYMPRQDYRAQIYHMIDCPQAPVGDRFVGLDYLVTLMGHEGLKFYRSATESMESGPEGLIAADDVVVIKINYQWPERGGTNVDVLSGLIRRIVDHPDTFAGEIVVCENAQFNSVQNFDRSLNNAEDHGLSPHDVVLAFQGLGYNISHFDWTVIRFTSVNEYSEGNTTDGYVVYDYDPQLHGRISYPKFQADSDTYISLKYGIWDPDSETYDRAKLKFINVPVLKSHHATYGATACVKDYMGVVTRELSTNSHSAIRYGILGALLGEIQLADLNILDCIWINANPYSGPQTGYDGATRRDELVASLDPVAADIWAVKYILIPAFLDNGYSPPWPYPSADPDDPSSEFREYLDNSMNWILAAGYDATNDSDLIDVITWSGGGDLDQDGVPDDEDNCPYDANADQEDCDEDGIGDVCAIAQGLSEDINENGIPDECECLADANNDGVVDIDDVFAVLAAWGPCDECPEDVNYDGVVDIDDIFEVLADWGPCL